MTEDTVVVTEGGAVRLEQVMVTLSKGEKIPMATRMINIIQ